MTKMIQSDISKRFMVLFFVIFSIAILFAPNYFSKSASSTFENGIAIPTIAITPTQNTTLTAYQKTTEPTGGFSNIVCKSGYEYVQMTGQYTAGNTSYKAIFLLMVLLDNNGNVLAKGYGHVDSVDAHKTITFNAITRYPSTFSSCIIQIDSAIPK